MVSTMTLLIALYHPDHPLRLVQMVREEMAASRAAGRVPTVWGAKITGGGSGGTVCILGEMEARQERTVLSVLCNSA